MIHAKRIQQSCYLLSDGAAFHSVKQFAHPSISFQPLLESYNSMIESALPYLSLIGTYIFQEAAEKKLKLFAAVKDG